MMWWKKKERQPLLYPAQDAAARMIADGIIAFQREVAGWLQKLERRCSLRRKKMIWLVFIISGSLYCGYILCHAIFSREMATASYLLPVAQPPPYLPPGNGVPAIPIDTTITKPNFK